MLCELLDAQLASVQQLSGWSPKKQSTAPRLSTLFPLHHQSFPAGGKDPFSLHKKSLHGRPCGGAPQQRDGELIATDEGWG